MPVTKPEDMSRVFAEAVNAGNLESLLALYESNAKYVTRSGKAAEGTAAIREILGRLLAAKRKLRISNTYCVASGDVALVRAEWSFAGAGSDGKPIESHGNSAEVLRRGSDGTWRYLIDHPFGAD